MLTSWIPKTTGELVETVECAGAARGASGHGNGQRLGGTTVVAARHTLLTITGTHEARRELEDGLLLAEKRGCGLRDELLCNGEGSLAVVPCGAHGEPRTCLRMRRGGLREEQAGVRGGSGQRHADVDVDEESELGARDSPP